MKKSLEKKQKAPFLMKVLPVVLCASGLLFGGCDTIDGIFSLGNEDSGITFLSVTANGNNQRTTSLLILNFSAPVPGLASADIVFSSVTNGAVTKGILEGTGPSYLLPITNVTRSGDIVVTVSDAGGNVGGGAKTVRL